MESEPLYEVVWPLGRQVSEASVLPPRVPDLNGRVVAEVWDAMFSGDRAFELIREQLLRRFPDVRFVAWSEFGNIHGPDEAEVVRDLPERLRRHDVDAVIVGIGG